MKTILKYFIFSVLIILGIINKELKAQSFYMGKTVSDLYVNESHREIKQGIDEQNRKYLDIYVDLSLVRSYYNTNNKIYGTMVLSLDKAVILGLIEKLNKSCVIIDSKHWKMYKGDDILDIELLTSSDDTYCLLYRFE